MNKKPLLIAIVCIMTINDFIATSVKLDTNKINDTLLAFIYCLSYSVMITMIALSVFMMIRNYEIKSNERMKMLMLYFIFTVIYIVANVIVSSENFSGENYSGENFSGANSLIFLWIMLSNLCEIIIAFIFAAKLFIDETHQDIGDKYFIENPA